MTREIEMGQSDSRVHTMWPDSKCHSHLQSESTGATMSSLDGDGASSLVVSRFRPDELVLLQHL